MNRLRPAARRLAFTASLLAAAAAGALVAAPIAAGAQAAGFRDIPAGHWAADSVAKLVALGILKGAPAAPFAPAQAAPKAGAAPKYDGNKPVTRYELAVTLYRFAQYIERANKQPKGKLQVQGAPASGPQAVKALIAAGYLPATTPLAQNGTQSVTAKQYSDALAQVIIHSRANVTPQSPDSDKDIEHFPGGDSHVS